MRGWRGDADESGDSERMDERLSGWKKERERERELGMEASQRRIESWREDGGETEIEEGRKMTQLDLEDSVEERDSKHEGRRRNLDAVEKLI